MQDDLTVKPAKGNNSTETPLMAQYNQIKAKYPDAILLFRVGDFYETFGSDAVVVSGVLGIVLTKRNNGGSDVELAGFPHHSLELYLPRLVRGGYRVAICDQLEKPSPLKKIVRRGVTDLITPGVATGDTMLDAKQNNFLAALHFGAKGTMGIAFLDVSTGEFLVSEGEAHYIDNLLQSFSPSELIFSKSRKKDVEKILGDKFYLYGIDEWVFTEDYARGKLLEQFETQNLKGYGIEDMNLAQVAAGAALHYIASTEINNRAHLTSVARILPDKYVWLDRFSIRNLELLGTPHENGTALIAILDKTVTPMGSRLMKKWIALPLKDRKAIEARHDVVRYFIDKWESAERVEGFIKQIGDLERLISKVPLGKINPREVRQLLRALKAIDSLQGLLAEAADAPQLVSISQRINACASLRERIAHDLSDEPPVKIDKGGAINTGVNAELDELRHLVNNAKEILLDIQQRESVRSGIANLKVGFNNVFGYYLEVTNKHKGVNVPDDWVRKQTLTNGERYITDELKTLESKILTAEEKILALEEEAFNALVFALGEWIKPIQLNASLVAQLDCLLSFAKVALRQNYCRPQLNDGLGIDITEGRHPVIEQHLPLGEQYVPNDIKLDNEDCQIMMITGPNMAGKSALLRQTALICLMAQMGSFVPARVAKLGIIDKVFTRVGASDNLSAGESTFMVEMNETASILNNISERSLILLDEIGRGTSTYDGISIAWSIAEYLHDNGTAQPKTLFATHYHELNELADKFPRIRNYHVATKEINNKIIFLRKLAEGGTQHSFGIHVARIAGMPKPVVSRAVEILTQLESKHLTTAAPAERLKTMSSPVQLSIFETPQDPKLTELKDMLQDLDLNRLTPIECMLKLNELKKMIE